MTITITTPALTHPIVIEWSSASQGHNTTISHLGSTKSLHTDSPEDAVKAATLGVIR